MPAKTIIVSEETNQLLDRIQQHSGANHSESIRRAVMAYAGILHIKPAARKPKR